VRISTLLATTSARLSLLYSGLLVASFALAGGLTFIAARTAAERELRERITLEVGALAHEAAVEGRDATVAAIAARAERPGSLEYWLEDASGRQIAGDIAALTFEDGWSRVDLPARLTGSEGREHMLALTRTLGDGSRLTIGDDLSRTEAVRDAVLHALAWVGVATLLVGLVAGVIATRNALARMAAVGASVQRVAAGDLEARAPVRRADNPDDIDRLALAFNAMLERIAQLVASLRRVSTDVAHDLRTPLTHLQQRLELARMAGSEAARDVALEAAEQKVADVMRTFDAILRLAEIEAGTVRQRFVRVDLHTLIEDVVEAYRPDVEAAAHSLDIERLERVTVCGDRDLLTQALANLIENALRHTPPGTHIRMALELEDQKVRISVTDDGPGVPEEARAELLQPFARLDRSRSTSGSGLGLSIVAAVARLHAAGIELGDAGPGLRVTLTLDSA
jgi:signal transduction histidine kinase